MLTSGFNCQEMSYQLCSSMFLHFISDRYNFLKAIVDTMMGIILFSNIHQYEGIMFRSTFHLTSINKPHLTKFSKEFFKEEEVVYIWATPPSLKSDFSCFHNFIILIFQIRKIKSSMVKELVSLLTAS